MRTLLPLTCTLFVFTAQAQFLCEDFEGNCAPDNIPLVIDTAAGNLWQIGAPQKALFNAAYSPVNAIVTDTLAPCAGPNTSRFLMKVPMLQFGWWPEFFLQFRQACDMDTVHAGGFMEISYDTGSTWMNVFEDWVNPPNIELYEDGVGPIGPDSLSNGQLGFTGTTGDLSNGMHWIWSSFCWVQTGIPMPDTVLLRFTYYADSLASPGDGWMMDEFYLQVYMAHPISEYLSMKDFFVLAPNPMADRLFISYDTEGWSTPVHIAVHALDGRLLRTLKDTNEPDGKHNLICWRKDLPDDATFVLLKATIGDREHYEKVLVAP